VPTRGRLPPWVAAAVRNCRGPPLPRKPQPFVAAGCAPSWTICKFATVCRLILAALCGPTSPPSSRSATPWFPLRLAPQRGPRVPRCGPRPARRRTRTPRRTSARCRARCLGLPTRALARPPLFSPWTALGSPRLALLELRPPCPHLPRPRAPPPVSSRWTRSLPVAVGAAVAAHAGLGLGRLPCRPLRRRLNAGALLCNQPARLARPFRLVPPLGTSGIAAPRRGSSLTFLARSGTSFMPSH